MVDYLTPGAVAKVLSLSKTDKVLAWIKTGELVAVNVAAKPGGKPRWRIASDELEKFLAKRSAGSRHQFARRRKPKVPAEVIQFFE